MPKPNFVKKPIDKLLDEPLSKLPDSRNTAKKVANLEDEWENLQFNLDQGAYTTSAQIEKAVERMLEVEALLEELRR